MKKISYKKLLVLFVWILTLSSLFISLGFVASTEDQTIINKVNIDVADDNDNAFLANEDVRQYLDDSGRHMLGDQYQQTDIPAIEQLLNAHPAIENAEVSHNLAGEVNISVKQRTPIVRIITHSGESYYIDNRGLLMPLSDNYTARVIVASGEIFEPYARRYQYSIDQIRSSKVFSEISKLDDVFDVVNYISADSSLNALIQQVQVNREGDLELYPAIGDQKIIFGNGQNIAEKFNRLKLFYTEGLSKADAWNKYSIINLKYQKQVVCTKRKHL